MVVKITAQGGLNSAAFICSIDGGNSYTDEITVPVTGEYEIEGTGLKLKFTEATESEQKPSSFLVNDVYSFTTTGPHHDERRRPGGVHQAPEVRRGV